MLIDFAVFSLSMNPMPFLCSCQIRSVDFEMTLLFCQTNRPLMLWLKFIRKLFWEFDFVNHCTFHGIRNYTHNMASGLDISPLLVPLQCFTFSLEFFLLFWKSFLRKSIFFLSDKFANDYSTRLIENSTNKRKSGTINCLVI